MKRSSIILISVLAFIGIILIMAMTTYNGMVTADEKVNKSFEDIQTQYQRRFDLVPQLVATVDMAAENEKEILLKVTQYRAGITDAKTPADIDNLNGLGTDIKTAINFQMENYPQVGATAAFRDLQTQLEGTENRIAKARTDFNEAVRVYNTKIKRFPGNMFNSMYGFEQKEGFKITSEAATDAVDIRKEFDK